MKKKGILERLKEGPVLAMAAICWNWKTWMGARGSVYAGGRANLPGRVA